MATFEDSILPKSKAVAKSDVPLNILDFGVSRGTSASQTVAIKAALDANPGKSFYFPPGDYRLDTGLVIANDNSLELADGCRIYAGAAMTTMITYWRAAAGFSEDKGLTGQGWLLDGNLLADRILSLGKVIRFSLRGGTFKNGIKRGLVTEAGVGAELIAEDLRFHNTTISNVADNIAIEANMGDCHFRDIIMRDWTVAVKDNAANRWDRVHPWIGPDAGAVTQMTSRYPTSIGFDLAGSSDLQGCLADTYKTAFKFRTNGTSYTAPPRLRNCRATWADQPTMPQAVIDANQAHVFDNTDGIGADVANHSVKGHNTGAPVKYLTGPSTKLAIRNTHSHGFVIGPQGTTSDPFDYRNGVQQGTFLFTPTLYGTTGTTNDHAYTAQAGRMVVAGDTATYFIRVNATLDAATTFAGSLRVGGLPIPAGATGIREAAGSVGYAININAVGAAIFASTANPYVTLSQMDAAGMSEVQVSTQALRGKVVQLLLAVSVTHYV